MSRVFPLSPDGSAFELTLHEGVEDRTSWSRFGLKGPGTHEWCANQNIELPAINRVAAQGEMRLCRLGNQDLLWLGTAPEDEEVSALRAKWETASQGYSSWREEAWAWLHLCGPLAEAALRRLTAVDLRAQSFPDDGVLQTRVAHQDAVLLRDQSAYDIFFDVAATAQVLHDIKAALDAAQAAR